MDAWGPRRKIAVGCFVVGRAKARVAFMPPSGIRCDCVAEREVRHRLAVNSEVKECLGWHSECRARNVPTLRESAAHRIKGRAEVTKKVRA